MLKVRLTDRSEFPAGDDTILRELLHPAKHLVRIGYSVAHGRLAPGRRSKRHRLAGSEVYYFISGQGRMAIDDATVPIEEGSVIYVHPGETQSLENTGSTAIEFLCLVDPAWRIEDETILE